MYIQIPPHLDMGSTHIQKRNRLEFSKLFVCLSVSPCTAVSSFIDYSTAVSVPWIVSSILAQLTILLHGCFSLSSLSSPPSFLSPF